MSSPEVRRGPPSRAGLPEGTWFGTVRIRFSHCDPAGIVYFARYFDILNGVVEDWFSEALGLDYTDLIGRRRVGLGYGSVASEFVAPGFMGDRLAFAVTIERIGRASLSLAVHAYRDETPVLTIKATIVTTSLDQHRAIPIPDDVRAALEGYAARCTPGAHETA